MNWVLKHGDILNEYADALICSANVFLNLSGGVGGEILLRYGDEMQRELHRFLAQAGRKFVQPGAVVVTQACGTPFKAVLHAVAIDGAYDSSPLRVEEAVVNSLAIAASLGAKRVALTALATGFGRLSMREFAMGITPLLEKEYPPISEIVICVRTQSDRDELAAELPPTHATNCGRIK